MAAFAFVLACLGRQQRIGQNLNAIDAPQFCLPAEASHALFFVLLLHHPASQPYMQCCFGDDNSIDDESELHGSYSLKLWPLTTSRHLSEKHRASL